MNHLSEIDLHIHTTISDGTCTPEALLGLVREKGLRLFSVTDHDAIKGCQILQSLLGEDDPQFVNGVEFTCRDKEGEYHILGYDYDPEAEPIRQVIELGHSYRIRKLVGRLDFLKQAYQVRFPDWELEQLYALDNPGKPHIGNLMVKYCYANTMEEAIKAYINKVHLPNLFVRPEEAIRGILNSGGIPVLAHPSFGSGDQLILGEEMEQRLLRLMDMGLQGVEAFYSGFTKKLQDEMLGFAKKYDLYVTAGSDYHGSNKLVELGDTSMREDTPIPDGMRRFLEKVGYGN